MEDKRKLMTAIMSAIVAYIQTEQPPPSVTHEVKPQPEGNQQQHKLTTT